MIKSANLRDALAELIKARLPLKVFFNHVNDSSQSYAFVRLRPAMRNENFGYLQRLIRVDIQIVIAPDANGEIKHTDILSCFDELTEAICHPLQVDDRFITINDAESIIFDDIGTFSFVLDFTDCADFYSDKLKWYDFMRELEISTGDGGQFLAVK